MIYDWVVWNKKVKSKIKQLKYGGLRRQIDSEISKDRFRDMLKVGPLDF